MRPVDQTTYSSLDGNCFSACVASILEVPLRDVPRFSGPRQPWFSRWLAGRGLSASIHQSINHVPAGYSIAGGPSPRFAGRIHACVALDGVVIHDPHPSRDGLPSGVVEYVVIHGPTSGTSRGCAQSYW
jgi:hypothetical protein